MNHKKQHFLFNKWTALLKNKSPGKNLSNLVIGVGLVMMLFATPHLIDDFLYDIPAKFGLTNIQTQVVAGIFHAQFLLIFVLVARGRKVGYYGAISWGIFLALAGILKHLPKIQKPEPNWSGTFSEGLIIGIIITGNVLAISSFLTLRNTHYAIRDK